MKKLAFAVVVIFALFVVPAFAAADITGKWSGSFVITMSGEEPKDDMAFLDLKQNGTELTGTAGPNPDKQFPIQKGKVEGNKVTFEIQAGEPVLRFDMTLVDGHLKGEAKAEHEGRSMKAVIDLQRASK